MPSFLAIQSTYEQVEIGLFTNNSLRASCATHKFNASSELLGAINNLLNSCSVNLSEIEFIAINQGPGPFTTLRVAIATVNGISFATGIPLVAVQGLPAFIHEYHSATTPVTVAILNAFNKDLYYAIATTTKSHPTIGVEQYQALLQRIHQEFPHTPIQFIGNGVTMYRPEIIELFGALAHFPDPLPVFPSIAQIGTIGNAQWQKKEGITQQVLPDYLKNYSAIIRYPDLK